MAVVIKKKAVVKSGSMYTYMPDTFAEHIYDNFIEVTTPEELIELFKDDTILAMDTECKPLIELKNHDIKPPLVRRWIGSGKKASPVDVPFCISICNGKVAATMYDVPPYNKLKALGAILYNENIAKIFHNAKFDQIELQNIGIELKGKIHDTVIVTKLANENRPSFKLMDVVDPNKGITKFEYMVDTYKKTHKIADYSKIPRELLVQYANADVWNCWHTFHDEYPTLEAENLLSLYDTELAVSKIAYEMEKIGMRVDRDIEDKLKADLQAQADAAEQCVYDMAGRIFNMNSGTQLHKVMLDLGVDSTEFKYSEKGNVKLDKNEMARFEDLGVPIVRKVLEYKQSEKLLGTYANGIYDQADAEYRVHASINTAEATTGRQSVTKPALQTLPKKNTSIRQMFIPTEGYELYFFDLDQVNSAVLDKVAVNI